MIGFRDGPAAGTFLRLHRAPLYLRVVIDRTTGVVDALDQLTDEPGPAEDVHVYVATTKPAVAFIDYRGRNRHLSGRYVVAEYRHVADAPADELRATDAWRAWARAQPNPLDRADAGKEPADA